MIRFREATGADIPAIVDLLADDGLGRTRETGPLADYEAAWDEMQAQRGNTAIVAEDASGRIVACMQLVILPGLSLAGARRAQVEGVRVASDLRGQRIGAALVAEVERRARAAGCVLVQLTSNSTRTKALAFYEAQGFVPTHTGFKKMI